MKRFCSLLSLVLVICMVVSGCQSNPAEDVPDSSASVPVTDTDSSDMQPEAALTGSVDDRVSQSTLDEFANAAGDAPPQYDTDTIFTLENGVLTANGGPVPKNISELDLRHAEFPDYRFLEEFTGLAKLDLSNSSISDVSVLSGLTNLKRLNLASSAVLDLSPIMCLPNLWLLDVSATGIDFDAQDWSCQDTLEVLYISSTETSTFVLVSLPWHNNSPLIVVSKFLLFRVSTLRGLYQTPMSRGILDCFRLAPVLPVRPQLRRQTVQ